MNIRAQFARETAKNLDSPYKGRDQNINIGYKSEIQ
jgi:hypothetical protein